LNSEPVNDLGEILVAINAEKLTKNYRVYIKPFDRLREALIRKPCHELVEALCDVSFRVTPGDTLGIIGENGAGKSTLLKILAGTVRPTSGRVVKQGRIAALLELGSGFHPEFSGRQNIYLNAALLGLGEKEIGERENSIIEFSELGDVIDRPVKTYSSGMYVRLGFSIATSVDPDVLIIDEALSVGDQRFQEKCVDRMTRFREAGKTIIFCSHSMYLINELCTNSMWLSKGRVCGYGETSKVVSGYLAYLKGGDERENAENNAVAPESASLPEVMIDDIRLVDDKERRFESIEQFQTVVVQIKTVCTGSPMKGHLSIEVGRSDRQSVFGTTTKISGLKPIEFAGEQITELVIPSIPILGAGYRAIVSIGDEHALRLIHQVSSAPFTIESKRPEFGVVWIKHHWRAPGAAKGDSPI